MAAATMTNARLDRLLAVLVAGMAVSGLVSLKIGSAGGLWLFLAHGVTGGCLAAAVVLKLSRSLPSAVRRGPSWRLVGGLAVSLVAIAAIGGGFAWVALGRPLQLGTWTVMTLHAWAGLVLLPILTIHLLPRRWRLLKPVRRPASGGPTLSRRSALTAGGLLAVGGGIALAADALDRAGPGARRFTGSRELPAGGIPPTTTFFGEPTPPTDAATWRVTVDGAVARPGTWTLDELRGLGETDLTAILDCTSGWWIETGWRGVPLGAILAAAGADARARRVCVRSVTGWSTSFGLDEARRCLLATSVAGVELPAGNGAPIRLVAPDRRGLDWIKWVDRIEVG
jgi:Oxidoreductase molybdopterin binding domain